MPRRGLDKLTSDFADELSGLLNRTVCDGIRLTAVTSAQRKMSWVGYLIRRDDISPSVAIPLGLSGQPVAYLHVAFTLSFDDEEDYIQVEKSTMGVCSEADLGGFLFHYDYERGKNDYPDAHVQIPVEHPSWEVIRKKIGSERTFGRLHLPLGSKRFRPTLEDLIEFVIVEGIFDGRDGWEDALKASRDAFAIKQLRAAIRRNLDIAQSAVDEFTGKGSNR